MSSFSFKRWKDPPQADHQPAAQPTGGKPFFAAARRQPPRQRPRTDSEDHGLQDERAGRRDRTPAYLVLRDRAVERRRQRINILKNVWAKLEEGADEQTAVGWVSDMAAVKCGQCGEMFSLLRRRHHCRLCGRIYCSSTSCMTAVNSRGKSIRACVACADLLSRVQPAPARFDDHFSRELAALYQELSIQRMHLDERMFAVKESAIDSVLDPEDEAEVASLMRQCRQLGLQIAALRARNDHERRLAESIRRAVDQHLEECKLAVLARSLSKNSGEGGAGEIEIKNDLT